MEKITKREMFVALSDMADSDMMTFPEGLTADIVIDFCQNEIEQLDKKTAKAKEYAAKRKASNDELMDAVREALGNDFEPIADITARIEGNDVTVSKVTYRLGQLVKMGEAEKSEISIPATEDSKARKIMGYRLINVTDEPANLESVED